MIIFVFYYAYLTPSIFVSLLTPCYSLSLPLIIILFPSPSVYTSPPHVSPLSRYLSFSPLIKYSFPPSLVIIHAPLLFLLSLPLSHSPSFSFSPSHYNSFPPFLYLFIPFSPFFPSFPYSPLFLFLSFIIILFPLPSNYSSLLLFPSSFFPALHVILFLSLSLLFFFPLSLFIHLSFSSLLPFPFLTPVFSFLLIIILFPLTLFIHLSFPSFSLPFLTPRYSLSLPLIIILFPSHSIYLSLLLLLNYSFFALLCSPVLLSNYLFSPWFSFLSPFPPQHPLPHSTRHLYFPFSFLFPSFFFLPHTPFLFFSFLSSSSTVSFSPYHFFFLFPFLQPFPLTHSLLSLPLFLLPSNPPLLPFPPSPTSSLSSHLPFHPLFFSSSTLFPFLSFLRLFISHPISNLSSFLSSSSTFHSSFLPFSLSSPTSPLSIPSPSFLSLSPHRPTFPLYPFPLSPRQSHFLYSRFPYSPSLLPPPFSSIRTSFLSFSSSCPSLPPPTFPSPPSIHLLPSFSSHLLSLSLPSTPLPFPLLASHLSLSVPLKPPFTLSFPSPFSPSILPLSSFTPPPSPFNSHPLPLPSFFSLFSSLTRLQLPPDPPHKKKKQKLQSIFLLTTNFGIKMRLCWFTL
ncbi:hypothetical protein C7M84_008708 [Penaeus vannamei]|uniref:Uncharacterized protein n=1 Tax=Penaeus vannamei TaxID=6689 RepID=A0A423T8S8_PENVA|nr:hypothetical protein C7M84_008708 [Penaeus vannamei]